MDSYHSIFLCIIIILSVSSCKATSIPVSNFCLIYEPVYTAKEDTEITKKQVDTNNLAYSCLCERDIDICHEAGI